MNKAYVVATLLGLEGCTAAGASAINPSDDLHCAIMIRTLEQNADELGATPVAKKGLYVLQTWYFSKLKPERVHEAQGVFGTMKKALQEVSSVGQQCSNRAFSDPDSRRWKSIASADFDSRVVR